MVFERKRWRKRGGFGALVAGLVLLVAGLPGLGAAERAAPSEYDVKAAFLLNFAKFVSWPPETFPTPEAPVIIGVLGENPFGEELARLAGDVRVQGRPIVVRHAASVAAARDCHVIFIPASERDRVAQNLAALEHARSHALTVGETDAFLHEGGMIRFVVEKNKVRFEIRPEAASAAGLAISSKLLSLGLNPRPRT